MASPFHFSLLFLRLSVVQVQFKHTSSSRGFSTTASMTSRRSWPNCSRRRRLPQCSTSARRKTRRKVKSRVQKVKQSPFFRGNVWKIFSELLCEVTCFISPDYRRLARQQGPAAARGRVYRHLPEVQVLFHLVGGCAVWLELHLVIL